MFASIPSLISGFISGTTGFFNLPSIFTSPLIFGGFIFLKPGIIPDNINVPSLSLILISPVFIFGILAFTLISGPLIFLFIFGISTFPFKSTSPVFIPNLGPLIFPDNSPFNSRLGLFILVPSKFISAEGIFIPGFFRLTSKSVPIFGPLIFNFLLISKLPFPGISPVRVVSGIFAIVFIFLPSSLSFFPKIIPVIFS